MYELETDKYSTSGFILRSDYLPTVLWLWLSFKIGLGFFGVDISVFLIIAGFTALFRRMWESC